MALPGGWSIDYIRHLRLLEKMHLERANSHGGLHSEESLYWQGVTKGLALAIEALDLTIAENDDDRTVEIIRARLEETKRR